MFDFFSKVLYLAFLFPFLCSNVFAQGEDSSFFNRTVPSDSLNVRRTKIYLIHSDRLIFDKHVNPDYQLLVGDVRFRHDSAYMFCDSARFYSRGNSLFAYGHVRMNQGDSVRLSGAWFYYDGDTRIVKIRKDVCLENDSVKLYTDSLNYDRNNNTGYFIEGGKLINGDNTLTSDYGQYNTFTNIADFRDSVRLKNPNFTMENERLLYNTSTNLVDIVSPTDIMTSTSFMYSTKGWYNTKTEQSYFLDRSYIINKGHKLTADTIFYNRINGTGRVVNNVLVRDTVRNISMTGNYGYFDEQKDFTLLTDSAVLMEHSSADTLFLHADTVIATKDSIYNCTEIFHHVRYYRSDLQGVCDSMFYSTRDSVLNFMGAPVMWTGVQQLTGDTIKLFTRNGGIDYLNVVGGGMIISQEADSFFNQSSGREIFAYFDSSKVNKVRMDGNAEAIYCSKDKSGRISGLNRLTSSTMEMYLIDNKMDRFIAKPNPVGKYYPVRKIVHDIKFLNNFVWYNNIRPVGKFDIFRVETKNSVKRESPGEAKKRKRLLRRKKMEEKAREVNNEN